MCELGLEGLGISLEGKEAMQRERSSAGQVGRQRATSGARHGMGDCVLGGSMTQLKS